MVENPQIAAPLTLHDALRLVFELSGAESLELHSGDREPSRYITRASVLDTARAAELAKHRIVK